MSATTSPRTSGPKGRHRAATPTVVRAGIVVLVVGTVLSVGAALGSVWLARAGVLAALVTAVLVWRLGRSEARRLSEEFADRSVRSTTNYRSALDREVRRREQEVAAATMRRRSAEERNQTLTDVQTGLRTDLELASARIEWQRTELGVRRDELAALRAELDAARLEFTRLEFTRLEFTRLEFTRLEAGQLQGARSGAGVDGEDATDGLADVHPLPRHGVPATDGAEPPAASELEQDGPGRPLPVGTVVDLPAVDPGWDNLEVDVAVAKG